jgi:hypothetical protein
MRIIGSDNSLIDSMSAWERMCEPRHWRPSFSAYSVADFLLNYNGADTLRARVAEAVGEQVEFDTATPEYETRFDQYGRGRMHDVGIRGRTSSGKSLFVGVESKVNESFGQLVREVYLTAKARQIAGESTKAPERIESLLRLHFTTPDPAVFEVRYQLLYATAGTLAECADVSVLFVAVFKTPTYNEPIGATNYRDYVTFLAAAGASPLKLPTRGAQAHRLTLGGRELLCIYEQFELNRA